MLPEKLTPAGESGEFLCTRFELLAQLRAELGLLLQQIILRVFVCNAL